MRAHALVAAFVILTLARLATAQTCAGAKPAIPTTVKWVCSSAELTHTSASTKPPCNVPPEKAAMIRDLLAGASSFLPICLAFDGAVTGVADSGGTPRAGRVPREYYWGSAERTVLSAGRRDPQWNRLDLFVVQGFASPVMWGEASDGYYLRERPFEDDEAICLADDAVFIRRDASASHLAHEVGHWLGLLHTDASNFGRSCDVGDDIPDTVAETSADTDWQAREARVSCHGLDVYGKLAELLEAENGCKLPITRLQLKNIMTRNAPCSNRLTKGQEDAMTTVWGWRNSSAATGKTQMPARAMCSPRRDP